MKVVHVIKRIETIDEDIKELKKLEKYVQKNKSFTNPIYMSIEKQINILLGERIKLLDLKISNPPAEYKELDEEPAEPKKAKPKKGSKTASKSKKKTEPKKEPAKKDPDYLDDDIPMLTQDSIDARINALESEKHAAGEDEPAETKESKEENDDNVKLLDLALEKGNLDRKDETRERDKKVKFFRDNFPVE